METMQIQMWEVDKLIPYDNNVKRHDPDQVAKIAKSIKDLGWDQPIVVDKHGVIIKGHGRRLASISLGLKLVPVLVRKDLTDDQVKAARLADNQVALGSFDADMLKKELESINFDMTGIYTSKELDFMLADLGDMNSIAFINDIDAEVTKQNDVAKDKTEEIAAKRIPLSKVFGFKDITGASERAVGRFIAHMEHATGLTGEDALIAFARQVAS